MSLGQRIKHLREELDLTQEELGKILNVSKPTISRYEADTNEPNTETLKTIAKYFNVSTDYLLENTNIKNTYSSADKISESVCEDPELYQFWDTLKDREDLKLLFKQTKEMSPGDIKKIIRIIKAIEDEEDRNDG
ncbi:helix-turn-helix domain-containing protein [Clostridium tyrobutyricum]|uniref:helix-turn-helix domain-containing protein n=1 Tax=Clostridium tyrobutyricum TaxID=1519 RepID=UPI0010AA745A|nr:helix-turn-helix transcriptional regulator [Clostridium tyrobutyricum]QCH27958.1 HTH-type transcriptional regulator ImmR [Clostridium tyrobutyricum]